MTGGDSARGGGDGSDEGVSSDKSEGINKSEQFRQFLRGRWEKYSLYRRSLLRIIDHAEVPRLLEPSVAADVNFVSRGGEKRAERNAHVDVVLSHHTGFVRQILLVGEYVPAEGVSGKLAEESEGKAHEWS